VNDFWVYITHALSKWQDPSLFRATLICISSFVNCYADKMGDKLDTFVPSFLELLENPIFDKELKLDILILLGEVFLVCKVQARKYLKKFLDIIIVCCTAAIQITEIDFNYSEQLKDTIIETLMCVVHGLNE
jgi:importin subunit beta-1